MADIDKHSCMVAFFWSAALDGPSHLDDALERLAHAPASLCSGRFFANAKNRFLVIETHIVAHSRQSSLDFFRFTFDVMRASPIVRYTANVHCNLFLLSGGLNAIYDERKRNPGTNFKSFCAHSIYNIDSTHSLDLNSDENQTKLYRIDWCRVRSSALFPFRGELSAKVGGDVRNGTSALFMRIIGVSWVKKTLPSYLSKYANGFWRLLRWKFTRTSTIPHSMHERHPVCARVISWQPYDGVHTNTNAPHTSKSQTKSTRALDWRKRDNFSLKEP